MGPSTSAELLPLRRPEGRLGPEDRGLPPNPSAGPTEPEAELERLRELRREALRARLSSAGPPRASRGSGPVVLTGEGFPGFLSSHPRVVVDVWAPWCGPCRVLAPVVEKLARELAPLVAFAKLNADEEPALARRWNVEGIPTLLLFKEGSLADRIVGAVPEAMLRHRVALSLGPLLDLPEGRR